MIDGQTIDAAQRSLETATNNGAAILLWTFTATAAYFLKQFADGVRELRKEVTKLRIWMARIGQEIGVHEEPEQSA